MSKRQTTIVLKNSNIPNRPLPTTNVLLGEALVNTADGIIVFSGASSGSNNWVPSSLNPNYFEVGSNVGKIKIRERIVHYDGVEGSGLEGKILSGTTNGFVLVDSSQIQGISVFNENIPVSLSGGKTLGKYVSGQIVPASGKTFEEVMRDIAIEALSPTVTLTLTPNTIPFNTTSQNITLNYGVITNSLGATSTEIVLQFRVGSSSSFTTLTAFTTTNMSLTGQNFVHSLTLPSGNTQNVQYRVTAVDNLGGSITSPNVNLTQTQYSVPTVTNVTTTNVLTNNTFTNNAIFEFGNSETNINFRINRITPNASLQSYTLQRNVNGGAFSNVGGNVLIGGNPSFFDTTIFTDSTVPTNATSVSYRVNIFDSVNSVTPHATGSIRNFNLVLPWFFGSFAGFDLPTPNTLVANPDPNGKRIEFSNSSITMSFANPGVSLRRWILVPLSNGGTAKNTFEFSALDNGAITSDSSIIFLGNVQVDSPDGLWSNQTYALYASRFQTTVEFPLRLS